MKRRFDRFQIELTDWLRQNNTDPVLEEGIIKFVQRRGTQQFDLHERETIIHKKLEVQINNIGWNHFMEVKLPILLGTV